MNEGDDTAVAGDAVAGGAVMAGRSGELRRLHAVLARPAERGWAVAEVVGDPGIGKTSLLARFARQTRDSGVVVLAGRATEFEHQIPFGLFADAIEDHVTQVAPERLAALHEADRALLRTVFTDLAGAGAGAGADPRTLIAAERYRLHRAMRALLIAVAGPRGLVIVLDDVHWADEASAELLAFLLRHPPRGPVSLAVAHRPRQLGRRLRQALADAVRAGAAERVDLPPLSPAEAEALLGASVEPDRRAVLYQASGGNPLYLLALARGGTDGRHHRTGGEGLLPDLVWGAFSAELAALSPADLLVAQAVAVTGNAAEPGLIAAVAGCPVAEVFPALDRLAARDVLRPDPVTGRFPFRHPVVRSVTYEVAPAGWRIAAHARAAAALGQRGASSLDRAHHLERSAVPGDLPAVTTLREAAVESMPTAPATAGRWLAKALELLPAAGRADPAGAVVQVRRELLGLHAQALGVTGELPGARDDLRELLRLMPEAPAEPRARVAVLAATVERVLEHPEEADALLRAELAGQVEPDGAAASVLKVGLATCAVLRSDPVAARGWTAQILSSARQQISPGQLASTLALSVLTDHLSAEPGSGTDERLDEAADTLDAMSDADLASSLDTVGWVGAAEIARERIPDAIRHLGRVLVAARGQGRAHLVTDLCGQLGTAYALLGDLPRSIEFFDDEYDAALLTGSPAQLGTALKHQCWLAIWRGDLPAAIRMGSEALDGAAAGGHTLSWSSMAVLAQAHLLNGDPATAARLLHSAGDRTHKPTIDPVARIRWLEALSAAEAAQGNLAAAADAAGQAQILAARSGLRRSRGHAAMAAAHAVLANDPAAAVEQARSAAAVLAGAGDRLAAGRAHHLTGNALAAAGEPAAARAEFARARGLFEACQAPLMGAEVIRDERRMNARRSRSGEPTGLTARELEVASLVAEGLTNKQIAQRLFLSVGTVRIHVGRIFAKLGVARRAAVAARFAAPPGRPPH